MATLPSHSIMPDVPTPSLKLFEFRSGSIIGQTDAVDAEHFAADFQGLRHFAQKAGDALDLGPAWMAGLREADYAVLWSCSLDGESGQGAMINARAPLFELLQNVEDDE